MYTRFHALTSVATNGVSRGGRRRLGVDLTPEAFEAWHRYARANGVSVTSRRPGVWEVRFSVKGEHEYRILVLEAMRRIPRARRPELSPGPRPLSWLGLWVGAPSPDPAGLWGTAAPPSSTRTPEPLSQRLNRYLDTDTSKLRICGKAQVRGYERQLAEIDRRRNLLMEHVTGSVLAPAASSSPRRRYLGVRGPSHFSG